MSDVVQYKTSFDSQRLWRATSPNLRWKWWHEDAVVFNPLSGDTHRLNLIESAVLKSVCDNAGIDVASLFASVSQSLGVADDKSLRDYFSALLEQYEELGLIEAEPTPA